MLNEVYREYFPEKPSGPVFHSADLVKPDFLVEIASIAHLERLSGLGAGFAHVRKPGLKASLSRSATRDIGLLRPSDRGPKRRLTRKKPRSVSRSEGSAHASAPMG
jgi:hypothetical protein